MLFLLGSIVLTSYLTLWFKVIERLKIPNTQVIVFNYFTCVITGSIVNGRFPVDERTIDLPWFPWAMGMGVIFISLFHLVGFTTQKIGVAVTSVANKLSLVIPFTFSVYLYNEVPTFLKVSGIVVAFLAIILTCWPNKNTGPRRVSMSFLIFLTLLLFFCSGLLDTMIKYVEHSFLSNENKNDYLVTAFTSAATVGFFILCYLYVSKKQVFDKRAVLAGIVLGIPNYFSIRCLIQVLKKYGDNSSAIIPINNMGIVLVSTVVAWALFREKLSFVNWLGIFLSLVAIGLVAYG